MKIQWPYYRIPQRDRRVGVGRVRHLEKGRSPLPPPSPRGVNPRTEAPHFAFLWEAAFAADGGQVLRVTSNVIDKPPRNMPLFQRRLVLSAKSASGASLLSALLVRRTHAFATRHCLLFFNPAFACEEMPIETRRRSEKPSSGDPGMACVHTSCLGIRGFREVEKRSHALPGKQKLLSALSINGGHFSAGLETGLLQYFLK